MVHAERSETASAQLWEPVARLPRKMRERVEDEELNIEGHYLAAVQGKLVIVQTVVKKKIVDGAEEILGPNQDPTRRLGFMSVLSPPWWEDITDSDVLAWELKDIPVTAGIVACAAIHC